jgi:hypothetical protein
VSARPDVPRLSGEDLDLLISRSLDGDLSAEEESRLQQVLAADPAAARRRDDLAGVVASLKALPTHEPPFAIATRVNVQVADRAKGLGSTWHRFGLYPAPGLVALALALVVALGLASVFLNKPRPLDVATAPVQEKKPEPGSPVEVFFQSNAKDAPASQPAAPAPEPKARIAENQVRREMDAESAQGRLSKDADRMADTRAGEAVGGKAGVGAVAEMGRADTLEPARPANPVAEAPAAPPPAVADASSVSSGLLKEEESESVSKQDVKNKSAKIALQAPAVTGTPRDEIAAGTSAPAPPARRAMELRASAPKPRWSISIVGPAQIGASWRLKKTPTTAPPEKPVQVLYRLTLDRSGRVVSARPQAGPVPAEVQELVLGLLFESSGEAVESREVEVEITAK